MAIPATMISGIELITAKIMQWASDMIPPISLIVRRITSCKLPWLSPSQSYLPHWRSCTSRPLMAIPKIRGWNTFNASSLGKEAEVCLTHCFPSLTNNPYRLLLLPLLLSAYIDQFIAFPFRWGGVALPRYITYPLETLLPFPDLSFLAPLIFILVTEDSHPGVTAQPTQQFNQLFVACFMEFTSLLWGIFPCSINTARLLLQCYDTRKLSNHAGRIRLSPPTQPVASRLVLLHKSTHPDSFRLTLECTHLGSCQGSSWFHLPSSLFLE